MIVNEKVTIRNVYGIGPVAILRMKDFIQGAVYCWCKNCKDNKGGWFAARDLFGGDNYYWNDTPLMALYNYYSKFGDSNYAIEEAGKAVGRLLLQVLEKDKRHYYTRCGYTREYRWTGEEE